MLRPYKGLSSDRPGRTKNDRTCNEFGVIVKVI
jgi:hypothetical protein